MFLYFQYFFTLMKVWCGFPWNQKPEPRIKKSGCLATITIVVLLFRNSFVLFLLLYTVTHLHYTHSLPSQMRLQCWRNQPKHLLLWCVFLLCWSSCSALAFLGEEGTVSPAGSGPSDCDPQHELCHSIHRDVPVLFLRLFVPERKDIFELSVKWKWENEKKHHLGKHNCRMTTQTSYKKDKCIVFRTKAVF